MGSTIDHAVHDEVDDDRLKDKIRDVGAESFTEAHGYGSMSSDVDSIVSWINKLHTVVGGVKIHEFEGNKWMD